MNYGAGILVVIGGGLFILAIRGSYRAVWQGMTGETIPQSKVNTSLPSNYDQGTQVPSNAGFVTEKGGYLQIPGYPAVKKPALTDTSVYAGSIWEQVAAADAEAAGTEITNFLNMIRVESDYAPLARSPAGALGIAQFMPGTAREMGIDPLEPVQALKGAALYLVKLGQSLGKTNYRAQDAAYNAGLGTVQSAMQTAKTTGKRWESYLPAETQNYLRQLGFTW